METRPYVSFAEVKVKVSILDALEVLGLAGGFQPKGQTLVGVCPLPSHKHGPRPNPAQFKINCKDGTWLWHCFGDCQRGGDVIELVKAITGYDNAHVRFWFAEHFRQRLDGHQQNGADDGQQTIEKDTARETPREEVPQAAPRTPSNLSDVAAPFKSLRFRLNLDPAVPYLHERGLTQETIARYGLGLCRRGVLKGYVAIPVYGFPRAPGDNPVAYLGRWPGEDFDEAGGRPRYKWPDGFAKSRVVYGLAEALDGTQGQPLVVVEGPFKAYQLHQAGITTAVAIFGSSLSHDQAELLIKVGRPILLLLDDDEAGRAGAEAAVIPLVEHTFVRSAYLPATFGPNHPIIQELLSLIG
jgi:DNA primase